METAQKASRKYPVNPERRYIRLQVVGMSFGLSIPPAMMLAYMFNLGAFTGHIAVLLAVVGCVFFCFGLVGQQEFEKQRGQENNSNDNGRHH